jgi:FkbM family methyltransferase
MIGLKGLVKAGFRSLGLEVQWTPRTRPPTGFSEGADPYRDLRRLTAAVQRPIIFDVGANVGQSIEAIRTYFPSPIIHAFEPVPATFELLRKATEGIPDLTLNNLALGRQPGRADLRSNSESVMSSLLELGPDGWGKVEQKISVPVNSLDSYCAERGIDQIDVLKLDTQGFELEVLGGAENLLREGRIDAILMEITFLHMYEGLPSLDQLYRLMTGHGLYLVSFYDFHYLQNRLGWCDALFARQK